MPAIQRVEESVGVTVRRVIGIGTYGSGENGAPCANYPANAIYLVARQTRPDNHEVEKTASGSPGADGHLPSWSAGPRARLSERAGGRGRAGLLLLSLDGSFDSRQGRTCGADGRGWRNRRRNKGRLLRM